MKNIVMIAVMVLSMVALSVTASAEKCGTKYMKDPCAVDGYGIVQTERFVRGRHNWMHDIHHFGSSKRVMKKRKRRIHQKRRYKYIKRCRLVKVRR